jgi:alanine dehydrogenase
VIVGVPREVKDRENRVSVTPAGVGEFVRRGHTVIVEVGAGDGSSFTDAEYIAAGATIELTHAAVFDRADMVVKVKEPTLDEYALLRPNQILFTYLHLANDEPLTRALMDRQVQAIAYETVQLATGPLPLLQPMSEVAGRMSVQVGAHFLEKTHGGRGVLLGGVPGVPEASVVVIGGGIVGTNAAQMALGMGANVTILDMNIDRLRYLDQVLHGRVHTIGSNAHTIAEALTTADLVIGSVLIPGKRAPKLVTAEMVAQMRAGSVMVDVAIDQGGCFATSHPTTHSDPTYLVDNVIHYCVTNMPGALPRTATLALANVTLPYAISLADNGFLGAVRHDPSLAKGVNVLAGEVTHAGVAEAFNITHTPLDTVLASLAA